MSVDEVSGTVDHRVPTTDKKAKMIDGEQGSYGSGEDTSGESATKEVSSKAPDWSPDLNRPAHIAIIMDGNQRWARARGLPGFEGHKEGAKAVRRVLKACVKLDVQALTLFAFSSENWRRPEEEVSALMRLFWESLRSEVDELVNEGVRLCFFGDLSAFDQSLKEEMELAMKRTASNTRILLNIAVNYGGRWDILNATRQMIQKVSAGEIEVDEISESLFDQYLSLNDCPPVDLCIRTSGEQRISNFLLWQLAYAELIFTPTYWPDFDESNLKSLINVYGSRQRRFGRSAGQIELMQQKASEGKHLPEKQSASEPESV